jgi:hypothetical protein
MYVLQQDNIIFYGRLGVGEMMRFGGEYTYDSIFWVKTTTTR